MNRKFFHPVAVASSLAALVALSALPHAHAQAEPAAPTPPPAAPPPEAPVPDKVVVPPPPAAAPAAHKDKPWYERIKLRGYTQFRYNRLPSFDKNEDLLSDQGDKSIGGDGGFFIRRARLIIFGDMSEHVSIYLQPDFASSISEQQHVAILRDWYADLHLDSKKEFRFRVGQSKVPFGFENMQSSSNRLPFDRADPTNSAVKDERDLGVFFYWAPAHVRARFKHLVDAGLKGSGDYGVLGVGFYNGQTANRLEANDSPHAVARLTWPFLFGEQFVEASVQGYMGKYNVRLAQPTDGNMYRFLEGDANIKDERLAATFVLYPQPFGFVAEGTVGRGPAFGRIDRFAIDARNLQGGYVQTMYKIDTSFGHTIIPYVRGQYYRGGKKFENNAPRYEVKELEMGVEWQLGKWLEITGAYMISDRTSPKYPYKQQEGHVTRLQVQVNY